MPLRIHSRKKIDISYPSLLYGLLSYLHPFPLSSPRSSSSPSPSPPHSLITLSARSALSALLSALALPPGSEILLSAITIPSIPILIRAHGLVPVPVDVRPEDTALDPARVEGAITQRTRAVVVAQLFGARWDISELVEVARRRGVVLVEDCAQGFVGEEEEGLRGGERVEADVRIFSFGPIKTCSALGGGVVHFAEGNDGLRRRMEEVMVDWEVQSSWGFWGRLGKYTVIKTIAASPLLYGILIAILNFVGVDSGKAITNLGRNVALGKDLVAQVRKRPCSQQAHLLRKVVEKFEPESLKERGRMLERLVRLLPKDLRPIGFEEREKQGAGGHYWLCPIRVKCPKLVVEKLLEIGVDAADGGTSLVAVEGEDVLEAKAMMREVVYLPIDHSYNPKELIAIARVFKRYGLSEAAIVK